MEKKSRSRCIKKIHRPLCDLENTCWKQKGLICGVDEVGRGCLAGPIVAAAVVLYPNAQFRLIQDSKFMTEYERLCAARWICQHSWYAWAACSHQDIDQHNIYHATLRTMRKAVAHVVSLMPHFPTCIVVDAMPLSFAPYALHTVPVHSFVRGEQRSISVAAASIIAKVTRDELMGVFDRIFPGYSLKQHKGYATDCHQTALAHVGQSIIHRQSFLKNIFCASQAEISTHGQQQTLFCRSN